MADTPTDQPTPSKKPEGVEQCPSTSKVADPGEVLSVGERLGQYEVVRHLGDGGMGVVYQARDTRRGTMVALKTLHRMDPSTLLRLKNEFRFISNINHRNLVSLHELVSAGDKWFLAMEFIDGESLWSLIQRAPPEDQAPKPEPTTSGTPLPAAPAEPTVTSSRPGGGETTASLDRPGTPRPTAPAQSLTPPPLAAPLAAVTPRPLLEPDNIRRIFRQIASGIAALHSAKKLHCDIKPRNVMVARDGRVVLLDFGLARDVSGPIASELAGTPAYISPEQLLGQPPSEASDWYAFGVMLYEALTGTRPFNPHQRIQTKVATPPPPILPSPRVPDDLRELCMALLSPSPEGRPPGREVLRRLGESEELPPIRQPAGHQLIGREEQLAVLQSAFAALKEGHPVVVHVHGESGLGKTALLRQFFANIVEQPPIILGGRCYERETVPYKGFDSLVDSLTQHLRTLPPEAVEALTPHDIPELIRIFPVLRQVEAFSQIEPGRLDPTRDQHEIRQRAVRTFKDLLSRLARTAPLVLHIDDLQWGDQDSAIVLAELVSPPHAPNMLLICSYRTAEAEALGLLNQHRKLWTLLEEPLDLREVALGPLSERDAIRLAAALLGEHEESPLARAIAKESHGNPLFVEELARYTLQTPEGQRREQATLGEVVMARVAQLPEGTRRLLETVAVAGRPVRQGHAFEAAAIEGDPHAPWTALRSGNLVRTRGARDEDRAECYHDRIRETVYASIPAERLANIHLRLATVFEAAGKEPQLLARHYREAGVREKAGQYALLAGDRAASALAFERAAAFYAEALECLPGDLGLKVKRADALVNAGRLADAAPLYLEAAGSMPAEQAFHLRRRSAEQYLASGRIREGLEVLKPLLAEVGLPYPASPKQALLGVIGRSIQLQLRNYRYRERPSAEISPELLKRVDVAWSASKGLGSVELMRGVYFIVRGIQFALESGERCRIARALSSLGLGTMARGGRGNIRRGSQFLAQGDELSVRIGDPALMGFSKLMRGMGEMTVGEWPAAARYLEESSRILEERCTGVSWELSQAHASQTTALWQLGQLRQIASRAVGWLRTAEQNGDLYGTVWLKIQCAIALIAADDPVAAAAQAREALRGWSADSFTPQQLTERMYASMSALYRGDTGEALKSLESAMPAAEASYALGWQFTRVHTHQARAAAALAHARAHPEERPRLLPFARKLALVLDREARPFAHAAAALIRGATASIQDQRDGALRELDKAIAAFEESGMELYAASARRQKGKLIGGEEGRALVTAADAAMTAQGIRNPERWTAMTAAGFPTA